MTDSVSNNQPNTSSISIGAHFSTPYVSIRYYRCGDAPTESNVVCAPREEINQMLSHLVWLPYYEQNSVNPADYKNPITATIQCDVPNLQMTNNTAKRAFISLTEIEFSSDNGFLLTSEKIHKAINGIGYTSDTYAADYFDDGALIDVIVRMNQDKIVHRRQYEKIQDVLAKVSGMINPVFIFFGFLSIPYAKDKMFELIINQMYRVQRPTDKKPVDKKKHKKKPSGVPPLSIVSNKLNKMNKYLLSREEQSTVSPMSPDKQNISLAVKWSPQIEADKSVGKVSDKSVNTRVKRRRILKIELADRKISENGYPQSCKTLNSKDGITSQDKIVVQSPSPDLSTVQILEGRTALQKQKVLGKQKPNPILGDLLSAVSIEDQEDEPLANQLVTTNQGNILQKRKLSEASSCAFDLVEFDSPKERVARLARFTTINKGRNRDQDVLSDNEEEVGDLEAQGQQKDPSSPNDEPKEAQQILEIMRTADKGPDKKAIKSSSSAQPRQAEFKFSYVQWIKSLIVSKPVSKGFKKAKKEVAKHIDILNIIRKFREVDNLKLCLLSDQQKALFDKIPKPSLFIDDEDEDDDNDNDNDEESMNKEGERSRLDAKDEQDQEKKAYNELRSKTDKSELDNRILLLYLRHKDLEDVS